MSLRTLEIAFVVGRGTHPQAVIDDLWNRAKGAVDQAEWRVIGTAAYVGVDVPVVTPTGEGLQVLALGGTSGGRIAQMCAILARKPGPLGVAGRLLRDNLESRRLARAVSRSKHLAEVFRRCTVVVSADLAANRTVWALRHRTNAALVHGPMAMQHAIRKATARG